jgi:hypothetical protein
MAMGKAMESTVMKRGESATAISPTTWLGFGAGTSENGEDVPSLELVHSSNRKYEGDDDSTAAHPSTDLSAHAACRDTACPPTSPRTPDPRPYPLVSPRQTRTTRTPSRVACRSTGVAQRTLDACGLDVSSSGVGLVCRSGEEWWMTCVSMWLKARW